MRRKLINELIAILVMFLVEFMLLCKMGIFISCIKVGVKQIIIVIPYVFGNHNGILVKFYQKG